MICVHAIVSGKVQGVFFRASTCEKAQTLGLCGRVKNLSDGTVDIIACGDRSAIMLFIDWLRQGPPRAQVSRLDWKEIPVQHYSDFRVTDDMR